MNGYKTYLAAFLLAVFAVSGYVTGELEQARAGITLLEAFAIAGLRHGIANGR